MLAVHGAGERTLDVEVGGRVPVMFDLEAAEEGAAVLTFSVAMNGETDGIELKLPINHPSDVRVMHVAHGEVRKGQPGVLAVSVPAHAIPASAQLSCR